MAAGWLAIALVVMPFLQLLPIDFDRSAPLFLVAPVLWFGRHQLAQAAAGLGRGPRWLRLPFAWAALAVVMAVVRADQPAAAAVTAATWTLLTAAGLVAGQLVRQDANTSHRLLLALAVGTAMGTVAVWLLWSLGGRGAMPLYAHHRHLGLHTLAGAIAATALLAGPSPSRNHRIGYLVTGVLTWAGLLWSGGRGPVLALAGGLACWFVVAAPPLRRALATWATVQLIAGLAISAVFQTDRPELGWWHAFQRTAVAATAGDASALTSTRTEFWPETLRRARSAPVLGHGPDAYRFLTPKLDGQQPHNLLLQLWLDVGLVGAVPLLALLGTALFRGTQQLRSNREASPVASWLALLLALTFMSMLDGVFYHVLTFLPALLAWGIVVFQTMPATATLPRWTTAVSRSACLIASALLLVHTWIFRALAIAAPPADPRSFTAQLVQAFPSTTFGLWRWTDAWQEKSPDVALAWLRWAAPQSSTPWLFHIRAAQLLRALDRRNEALAELRAAEAEAHWTVRPSISAMVRELETSPR